MPLQKPARPSDILEVRGEIVELKPAGSKPEPGAEEELLIGLRPPASHPRVMHAEFDGGY